MMCKRKTLSTCFICLLLMLISCACPVSAENTADVNGVQMSVGDTFTYTFNVSDAEQKISGMQINIFFDQDVLELLEVTDGVLGGTSVINDNQGKDGRIVLVNGFMNGGGLECKEKTALATATFKVIAPETTEVTYFVQYLYDIDMIDIYSYTFTCDITSEGTVISENKTPILADSSMTDVLTYPDNFRNNQEGKGDGIKREPVTEPETTTAYHSQTGENAELNNENQTEKKTSKKSTDRQANNSDASDVLMIVLGFAAIALIIITLILIWWFIIRKIRES